MASLVTSAFRSSCARARWIREGSELCVPGQDAATEAVHHKLGRQGTTGVRKSDLKKIETELGRLFEECGPVVAVIAKRNRNSEYCFAFAEMQTPAAAQDCVKKY